MRRRSRSGAAGRDVPAADSLPAATAVLLVLLLVRLLLLVRGLAGVGLVVVVAGLDRHDAVFDRDDRRDRRRRDARALDEDLRRDQVRRPVADFAAARLHA